MNFNECLLHANLAIPSEVEIDSCVPLAPVVSFFYIRIARTPFLSNRQKVKGMYLKNIQFIKLCARMCTFLHAYRRVY